MNKSRDLNAKNAEAGRTQRKEIIFVGRASARRETLVLPPMLEFNTLISKIFLPLRLCELCVKSQ